VLNSSLHPQAFFSSQKKRFKLGFLILGIYLFIYLLSVLPYLAMAKKKFINSYCDIHVLNQDQCSFFWRNFGIFGNFLGILLFF